MATEKKNKFRAKPSSTNVEDQPVKQASEQNDIEDVATKTPGKNKVKSTAKVSGAEPKTNRQPKTTFNERLRQLVAIYKNERSQRIIGLLLVLCSAYLSIALVSYFTSWDIDQDKVLSGDLFSPEIKVKNWLGKFGALISHWIMFKGFGAASFILVPVLAVYGVQMMVQRKLINTASFTAKWLFALVWLSMLLNVVFNDRLYFMGGGFGYFINAAIGVYVGYIGLIALLVFSLLVFLVLSTNLSFNLPQRPLQLDEDPEPAISEEAEIEKSYNSAFNEIKETELTEEEEAALLNFEIKQRTDNDASSVIEPAFEIQNSTSEIESVQTEPPSQPEALPENENVFSLDTGTPEQLVNTSAAEPELEIASPAPVQEVMEDENKAAKLVEQFGEYDPTLDLGSYQFPHFDLLNDYGNISSNVKQDELIANKNKILSTLKNYGIEIDKIMATVGPTVTLYEIVPAAGVRISKIKNLEDDIALSLAALGIRIIAPIPGKGTIGIEVPNQNPEMVPMRNILASEKFNNCNFELPVALGKTISNEIFIADLAKMPHLLMAGATGQGKSVGLNAVLVSLLYKKHPAQVKFVLVDPKKVELTLFNKIERHFLAKLPNSEDAIITDNTKVIHTLNSLCIEMDNRYALLQDAQVRNIKEYNAKFAARKLNPNDGHKYLPYIVLVVDEFADLIMTAGKEVETPIARLAQLARAIGIHLIIATQRPSVNIITGTIKANFPARIAFRVTSKIDSRTILDSGGADQLIGRGDMLLSTGNDLIRIQCAFVDTPEVEKITEFIGNQRAYPSAFLLPEYVGEDGEGGKEDVDLSERDKMFDDAARLVVQFQQGSASFLQRKLKLGYNRAGRIVDQLEAAGIIGPFEGSKAREVLVKDMMQLDDIMQRIKGL